MSTTWKMPQAPPPLPSPVPSRRRKQAVHPTLPEHLRGWRRHQASAVSLILHCSLFLVLALLGTGSSSRDGQPLQTLTVLEVQSGADDSQGFFVEDVGASVLGGEDTTGGDSTLGGEITEAGAGLPGADAAPVDMRSAMAAPEGDGNGGVGDIGVAAGGLGLGAGGTKLGGAGTMPQAKTSVFGIEGTGSRFVYVFDRSSSMSGYTGLPMANAKSELIKSLQGLGRVHQFQLIFYNETPMAYGQLAGNMGMLSGTEENKKSAVSYVRSMVADGSTEHLDALRLALGMGPDVIFFLTDAEEPGMTKRELDDLVERASRHATVIHTIQFGTGGNRNSSSWISELAGATGGKFRYIDVTTFTPSS